MRPLTLAAALVVVLGAGTSGCVAPGRDAIASNTAPPAAVQLPLPVRLGVRPYRGQHHGLHALVLRALREDPNFAEVAYVQDLGAESGSSARSYDYVVDLTYALETRAKWYNLLTCFPGFLVLAPHWAGLRWDYDVTTRLDLYRAGVALEVGRLTRRDEHDLVYTSPGYAAATNMGWFGIAFPPAVGSPLIGGIAATFADEQPLKYGVHFERSASGHEWGRRVAAIIAAAIEEDLGPPGRR